MWEVKLPYVIILPNSVYICHRFPNETMLGSCSPVYTGCSNKDAEKGLEAMMHMIKNFLWNLQTQQTPKPLAQDPDERPPFVEHSELKLFQ